MRRLTGTTFRGPIMARNNEEFVGLVALAVRARLWLRDTDSASA